MAEHHEMIVQMINEAGANKAIAATLKSARAAKVVDAGKFYLHNGLLSCEEQQSCS